MYAKQFRVQVSFVTASQPVRITRTFTLTDTLRSKAVARALRLVPAGALDVRHEGTKS